MKTFLESCRSDTALVVMLVFVALLSKAGLFMGGLAADDYAFLSQTLPLDSVKFFMGQVRPVQALIMWFLDINNIIVPLQYFIFGPAAIISQVLCVYSMLRFLNFEKHPLSWLIGALIIAHPFNAEIYTFKMSLPTYSFSLFLSAFVFELLRIRSNIKSWHFVGALFSLTLVLLSYQIMLNIIGTLIFISFLASFVSAKDERRVLLERAKGLFCVTLGSVFLFGLFLIFIKVFDIYEVSSRSNLMNLDNALERAKQILHLYEFIFVSTVPIMSGWQNKLILLLLSLCSLSFVKKFYEKHYSSYLLKFFIIVMISLSFLGLVVGMMLPFETWWPAPRTLMHVPIILTLFSFVGGMQLKNKWLTRGIFSGSVVLLISFILVSGQIFVDQKKVNFWDYNLAIQLTNEIKRKSIKNEVEYIYLSFKNTKIPFLRTRYRDLNISAFEVSWSKVEILNYVSGERYKLATKGMEQKGESYCLNGYFWPSEKAIFIEDNLAILCL